MIGLVDTGGGLRDIYGAGVLDRCLDDDISFDTCIGVSAGSANVASFLGKQKGRNYRFYTEYARRREYMSIGNFIKNRSYIDLDYVYHTLSISDGEDPVDYDEIKAYKGDIFIVATDAVTGKPRFFDRTHLPFNNYRVLNASSSIPLVNQPCEIDGVNYYDGGVSAPIPVDKALENGCDKVVVILTHSVDFCPDGRSERIAAEALKTRFPAFSKVLKNRPELYKKQLQRAVELEKQGKCLIVAPDDCCGVSTLTRDKVKLDALYKKGYSDGKRIKEFILKTSV